MRAAVSTDGGQTWSASLPISNHTDNSHIYGNVTVAPNGTFYAAWMRRYYGDRRDDTFFSKSTDGGLTWSTPVIAFDGHHYSGPSQIVAGDSGKVFIVIDDDQSYRRNLVLRYSLDFGNIWHTGTQLTNYSTNEGTNVPSMQVHGDTLYVLHKYFNLNTNFSRFDFMKSTDAGLTWSVPVQVNDSLVIDDNTNPGYERFYPCIAVAPGGQRIYAVWADRRENPSQQEYNVYFSFSLDGGQTWSPDVRVNEDTSGTYQLYPSVAVKSNGTIDTVLVIWQDDRQAPLVGVATQPGLIPTGFQLHQNYPNPFNPATSIEFALPTAGIVKLSIYDLLGREVRTLVAGWMPAGWHRVQWDGTDSAGKAVPSGVYLYRLEAGDAGRRFTASRKLVLLK